MIKYLVVTLLYLFATYSISNSLMAADIAEASEPNIQSQTPIQVVMSAAFVSDSGIAVYDEIFKYLGDKLGRKVDFISGFSYNSINSMLDSGMVDVGFICGLPYILKKDVAQPNIELLVAPVMKNKKYKNKPIYYSYVIVHKDSKFEIFSDLKGSRFVYNDEISNSGYNMPRAHLIKTGATSVFFGKIIRSGSHEESIRQVALGEADVSAVDSLVYDYDLANNPQYVANTKILMTLGPTGIPPVVVSTQTPLPVREKIRDIMLGMKGDPQGKRILDKALIDRFIIVDDRNYDDIRKMHKLAYDSGYQVIR